MVSLDKNRQNILTALNLIAPKFSTGAQDELLLLISFVQAQVSQKVFGDSYPLACALLTAHYLSTAFAASPSSSSSSTTTVDSTVKGPLLSETEGGLSRTYGNPATTTKTSSSSSLSNTVYGVAYLELKKSFVCAPTISGFALPGFGLQWPTVGDR